MSADESSQSDSESDSSEEFSCEHTCLERENYSCPVCRQGGDWDWSFLTDHAAQEHSLDTHYFGDESWKLAKKTFSQMISFVCFCREKLF